MKHALWRWSSTSLILGMLVYTTLLYLLHPHLFKDLLGYAQMLRPRHQSPPAGQEAPTVVKR